MPRPVLKWPHYALWALEAADADLAAIETMAREAQQLVAAGRGLESVILLGDVRDKARDARRALQRGRDGER